MTGRPPFGIANAGFGRPAEFNAGFGGGIGAAIPPITGPGMGMGAAFGMAIGDALTIPGMGGAVRGGIQSPLRSR